MTTTEARSRSKALIPIPVLLLLLIGIGVNIRSVLGVVPVLADPIRHALDMDASSFGLITSLTILTMAVGAPGGHWLATRIGMQWAMFWLLLLVALGAGLRFWVNDTWFLYATSVLVGAGMGGCSALAPGFISHTMNRIRGTATGIYSTSMAMGVAASAALAVPTAAWFGWRGALGLWGIIALIVAAAWGLLIPRLRRIEQVSAVRDAGSSPLRAELPAPSGTEERASGSHSPHHGLPLRDPTAWLVTALSALILLTGFAGVAWIAPTMQSAGYSQTEAAGLFGLFQLVQLGSLLTLPIVTDFTRDRRPLLAITTLTAMAGIAILLIDPAGLALPGVLLMGFGVGGGSTLTLVLLQDVTHTIHDAGRLSAMSLLFTYILSSIGPFLIGLARDLTGSFAAGYLILLGVTIVTAALIPLARPGRSLQNRA